MNNLTRYEHEGLELYIDVEGAVFATQRGIARMCEVAESTMRTWASARKIPLEKVEILTPVGVDSARKMVSRRVSLFNEDAMSHALAHFNPERLRQLAMLGLRLGMQQLVGWNKPETPEDMQVLLCPGSRTNRFYDRGNERHMVIFDLITPKTVDEDGLSTVFYKYQGDNGKGYALLETHSIDTGKRLYTLYASSDNYEGRMELYYFAKDQIDYMGIDCDDYSVQLLSKTGKPQKEIFKPLDRLTIDKKFLAKSSTQEEALSSSEQLMVKEKSLRDLLPVLTAEEEKKEQRFRFYKNMFENKNNNV